ncbi:GIY-YIG nuclease family protein [Secundilactobacillus yichangensis]|uniref:GIY-YIG nuclease family protein n=1 Tax=Secundilactobacillus yichangensis TaxID=2799580 RepID=UPI001943688D|nr:GIY-YIG nuclease family protein [Secundilactobacillus yichangensis]
MTKYYTTNDKFLVWAEDGILSDTNGHIISVDEVKELIESQQRFLSEHTQSEIDEYNQGVDDRLYQRMDEEAARPRQRKQDKGYVYFIQADEKYFKIGSTVNLKSRFKGMQTSSPNNLVLRAYFETNDCRSDEDITHEMFKDKLIRGEWYDISLPEICDWSSEHHLDLISGGDLIDQCNGVESLPYK